MPVKCLICESKSPKWIEEMTIDVPHKGALIKNLYIGISHSSRRGNICDPHSSAMVTGVGRVIEVPTGEASGLVNSFVAYHKRLDASSICGFSSISLDAVKVIRQDLFRGPDDILAIELSLALKVSRYVAQNAIIVGSGIEALASLYIFNKFSLNAYSRDKIFKGVKTNIVAEDSIGVIKGIDTIYIAGFLNDNDLSIINKIIELRDRVKIICHPIMENKELNIKIPKKGLIKVIQYPYTIPVKISRYLKGFIDLAKLNGLAIIKSEETPPIGYLYLIIDFS